MRAMRVLPFVLALAPLCVLAQEPSTPKQQTSVVYVYRYKQFVGSALAPSVYCDEVQLARMENGRYFAVNVDPGQHTFRSNDKQSGIQLDVKPGQEYFIRLEIAARFMKGHGRLILTAAEQGRYELQSNQLKPLDADKVADTSRVSVTEAKFAPATPAPSASANAVPKPAMPLNSSQDVTAPVNEVTLSDTPPDTSSQMSLGDAARTARQKKAGNNAAASPQ
jgi:Protein of unknown function (DUF2846)